MTGYPLTPEQIQETKLRKREKERRKIEEDACYNYEMDLWNTTLLDKLSKENLNRILLEKPWKK